MHQLNAIERGPHIYKLFGGGTTVWKMNIMKYYGRKQHNDTGGFDMQR